VSSHLLGLVELVLVFSLVLGFGFWQLYAVKRDQRRAEEARAEAERQAAARREGEPPERS
jgi:hypothetical protein